MCVHTYTHTHTNTHTHFAARVKQVITGTVMGFPTDAERDGRKGFTTSAVQMLSGTDGVCDWHGNFTAEAKRDGWRGGAEGLGPSARLGRVRRCISVYVNT